MKRRSEILNEVYEHLRNHYGIHTQGGFADAIGYSRPVISSALNGNDDNITDKMLRSINNKFPSLFDIDYLLTGEGQLLKVEEHVAKVADDDRTSVIKPEAPTPATEVPAEVQTLLDRALSISRRNEEMVERLVSAASQNKEVQISIENVARHLNESQQQVMQIRADILTATDAINTFRTTVDAIRDENERLKASKKLLGQRLNKAAALFADLNTKVAHLLENQSRYPVGIDTTHQTNEHLGTNPE
jgi:DNA repair ATPase RecN